MCDNKSLKACKYIGLANDLKQQFKNCTFWLTEEHELELTFPSESTRFKKMLIRDPSPKKGHTVHVRSPGMTLSIPPNNNVKKDINLDDYEFEALLFRGNNELDLKFFHGGVCLFSSYTDLIWVIEKVANLNLEQYKEKKM